ncbi:asparaginase [Leucobacter aridicollis]|uniref:asparaginase n=1 Tax=Leucobacter aridicollis TaxID=283878 RepID=UPI0021683A34|nr:asparaginase [Leucobacter aridicollis]MCS3427388.1 L-asparaginase [Leucobacter aridicollis]
MTQDSPLPHVAVVGLGGTIASSTLAPDDLLTYGAPGFHVDELLEYLRPELLSVAELDGEQVLACGSSTLSIADLVRVSEAVNDALSTADAVVVTSGSDALEEIAYWLDLTVPANRPVIVTGSMRPFAVRDPERPSPPTRLVHGADGPANLLAAIRVAASGVTAGQGVVVVFGDLLHAARDVVKRHSTLPDPFESPASGPIGYLFGGSVVLHRHVVRPLGDPAEPLVNLAGCATAAELPRVEILVSYPGGGGEAVDAYVAAGVRGLVIAGMGLGAISQDLAAAAGRAAENGLPVVCVSRSGAGSAVAKLGWEIVVGDLAPTKARLLLILALLGGQSSAQVAQTMSRLAMPGAPGRQG